MKTHMILLALKLLDLVAGLNCFNPYLLVVREIITS